jgi:hypothetical protein
MRNDKMKMIDKNLSLALGTAMDLMNYTVIDHKIAAGVLAGLIIGKVGRDLTTEEFTYIQNLISKENLTIS